MSTANQRRKLLIALGAGPALLAALSARGQGPAVPEEGTDYHTLPAPVPGSTPGKIEVLDFFWYGCPHCYAFLPDLEAFRKRLPADVAFVHVPVAFDSSRDPHSRIFYALQALNRVDELHVKVFDAFHRERRRLLDSDEIADFMKGLGVNREQWLAAYNSFSVASAVNRAKAQSIAYAIEGTPTLTIDGRFETSPSIASSHTGAGAIVVADYLIDRVRRERAGSRHKG